MVDLREADVTYTGTEGKEQSIAERPQQVQEHSWS